MFSEALVFIPQGDGIEIRCRAYDDSGHSISLAQGVQTDRFTLNDRFPSAQNASGIAKIRVFASAQKTDQFGRVRTAAVTVERDGEVWFDFDLAGDFGDHAALELGTIERSGSRWLFKEYCGMPSAQDRNEWLAEPPQLLATTNTKPNPEPSASPPALRPAPIVGTPVPSQSRSVPTTSGAQPSGPTFSSPPSPPYTVYPVPAPPPPTGDRKAGILVSLALATILFIFFAVVRNDRAAPPVQQATAAGTADASTPPLTLLTAEDALKLVYGNFDKELGGSHWIETNVPPKFSQFSGQRIFIRTVVFAEYVQGGVPKRLLLTGSSRYGQDGRPLKLGDDCHACSSLVGAATFVKGQESWRIESVERFLIEDGDWGSPPEMRAELDLSGAVVIHFKAASMHQGITVTREYSASLKAGTWSISEPVVTEKSEEQASSATSAASAPTSPQYEETSFDCAKAKSAAENLICSDKELARMDRSLAALYLRKLSASNDPNALRASSVAAWKWRESECSSKECLLAWYVRRERDLEADSLPPPATKPPSSIPQPTPQNTARFECAYEPSPEMPVRALRTGATGTVEAHGLVRRGRVVDVSIRSGPRIFHDAVTSAMLAYRCTDVAQEMEIVRQFTFKQQ